MAPRGLVRQDGEGPPPADGYRRVFARHSVGRLRAGRWQDVLATEPKLDGWIAAGLVSLTGSKGEAAPDDLPRPRCCGDR